MATIRSSAEVMYQHQHAPLPLDLLETVRQPVVVLHEMLLDPAGRFQKRPNNSERTIEDSPRC
jgi:hypothetical protein